MVETPALRVFLVDDHEIVLNGLSEYIGWIPDLSVVGKVTSAEEALRTIGSADPDVAVLDVRLPDMDGITLCREIRATHPRVKCLMLSSYASQDTMLEAIISGASGYVLKEARLAKVVDAIRSVGAGKTLLDPALTQKVLDRIRSVNREEGITSLTSQEERVLDLMALGLTNREISEQLYLAEQTVKNYVSVILSKLGMRRTEAAVYASNLKRNREEASPFED